MASTPVSNAFQIFLEKTPAHAKAWSDMVQSLAKANVLDAKTTALIYVSILAVLGLESGIPFHVNAAKEAGASLQEILCAVLVGLAPCGHRVTQALPLIVGSFDR